MLGPVQLKNEVQSLGNLIADHIIEGGGERMAIYGVHNQIAPRPIRSRHHILLMIA